MASQASQASQIAMQKLLTVSELSLFFHVHPQTIYRWAQKGGIPSRNINGLIRFSKEEIEEWQSKRIGNNNHLTQALLPHIDSLKTYDMLYLKGGNGAMARARKRRLNCGFGSVYTRPTKSGKLRFYLDYYDSEGNRKQQLDKTATTWEDAVLSLRKKVQNEHDCKLGVIRRKQNIGFAEFSEIYMDSYAKVAKKSWMTDEHRMKNLQDFFGQEDLRKITPLAIERFRSSRLVKGNTKSTVNRYLALLKKMFNLAIDEGYLATNPACKVKMYSEKDFVRERVLDDDEESRLLDSCVANLRPIVVTALNTGMRRGEILGLEWKNVDLSKRIITVEKTKSGESRRIPINDLLAAYLQKLKRISASERVFPFPFRKVRTWFENACISVSISGVTFHSLRHTFATRLIARGADIVTLQQLLGHHSITVTQKYAHSNEDRKRQAVELLKNSKRDTICDTSGTKIGSARSGDAVIPVFSMN